MRGPLRSSRNEGGGMKFKGKMRGRAGATLGRWASLFLWIFFLAGLSGCAHPISKGVMATVDKDRTFSAVMQDPEANVGSTVLWGGVIDKVSHETGETKLIVSQAPLNSRDTRKPMPAIESSSPIRHGLLTRKYTMME